MNTENLATVNNVGIICLKQNKQRLIPIKPICDAIGVDIEGQRKKIKEDEILSSVSELSSATGADEKTYEMLCLPIEFAFGWLFTINPKNVAPEAQEAVKKYKLECYQALFQYFTEPQTFLAEKQDQMEVLVKDYQEKQANFKNARQEMDKTKKKLNLVMDITIEQWRANNRQLAIPFSQECESE